jgi:hypothetical protein
MIYRFLLDGVYNDWVEERVPSGCFTVDGQSQQGKYLRHTSRGSVATLLQVVLSRRTP